MLIPKNPNGSLVGGKPDETLEFDTGEFVMPEATIQLHEHTDGRWMWSTSVMVESVVWGYDVGAMWGNFAASRDEALSFAVGEIRSSLFFHKCEASEGVLKWCAELFGSESKKETANVSKGAVGPLFSGI